MYGYYIYSQLKKHVKADKSFHMPGHKARGDFKAKFPEAPMDLTELSYTDNLLCPTGIIAAAQRDIAKILGARQSFILTDGSSSGVLTMLFAAAKRGSKIIVPRNSHQSVWNACKLFDLEPVTVEGETHDGIILPPDPAEIERIVSSDATIAGMIALSPDYYGNIAPLKEYGEILKKRGKLLLVDGAHGAHLAFVGAGYAGEYADAWVDGAHKTLPTLTQGAVLSVNDLSILSDIKDGLSIFRTTSPSFPIMASVEYGVKYVKNHPKLLEDSLAAIGAFRAKCPCALYPSSDPYKLAVDCKSLSVSSHTVAKALEKKGVYAELSDGRYLLFYLSPMTSAADLNRLLSALCAVAGNKKIKKDYAERPNLPPVSRTYSFIYALKKNHELVTLDKAEGNMCACNIGVAPPCVPVLVAGEIITKEAIEILRGASEVYGLDDGKIRVVAR